MGRSKDARQESSRGTSGIEQTNAPALAYSMRFRGSRNRCSELTAVRCGGGSLQSSVEARSKLWKRQALAYGREESVAPGDGDASKDLLKG